MAHTIKTLIKALQDAAENAKDGENTPVLFEAATDNEMTKETLTTINFGSIDVIGDWTGQHISMQFLITDDQLKRLNWIQKGCP